jgi:hypothetical protein
VAVVGQQWFDHLQDAVPHCCLRQRPAIEHLVAELGPVAAITFGLVLRERGGHLCGE